MYSGSSFKTLVFAAVLFTSTYGVLAAERPEWKPVSKAELEMTEPVVQPGADAEAIFWEVDFNDKSGWKFEVRHYVRIKIFTDRGREQYSKFNIEFGNETKIRDIAARVIDPSGEIYEVRESEIFEQDILKAERLKIRAKSFAPPKLGPGVIFEYQFRESHPFGLLSANRLLFQKEIPVQRASYYVKPQKGLDVEIVPFNMDKDFAFEKAEDRKGYLVVSQTNIPPVVEEPYMPPMEEVSRWAYIRYTSKKAPSPGPGPSISIIFDMSGAISAALFDRFTTPNGALREKALELTEGVEDDEEKVRRIYRFVQADIQNILYPKGEEADEEASYDSPEDAADLLKKRSGLPSHIDLLFASLVRSLGMEARSVMSADRRRHFLDPDAHGGSGSLTAYGVAVNVGGTWRYFRPGVPYMPFGQFVWYRQSVPARL
ncbi:MAG: DUF3857 and transglutaminase domain-containing protein [Acidobacteriota bacterium]|nr:MAG: DUF3857 and transglutaminase domain-containing protein [Acidobacteriota bacterium]